MLLMFWLIAVDRVKKEQQQVSDLKFYLPKFLSVSTWGLLTFIALSWLRSRHLFDPHIEQDMIYATQIYPMLITTDIIYFLIIVYGVYLIVSTWQEISPRHYYLSFPTLLYILSTLVAMFSGVTKSLQPSSLAFLYYFGLRNLYVYVLVFGYWPTESTGRYASNPIQTEVPGESQRLIRSVRRCLHLSNFPSSTLLFFFPLFFPLVMARRRTLSPTDVCDRRKGQDTLFICFSWPPITSTIRDWA